MMYLGIRGSTQSFIVTFFIVILFVSVKGPVILASVLGNVAMIDYVDATSKVGRARSAVLGARSTSISVEEIDRSLDLFKQAVSIDPDNVVLNWGLIRASLKIGESPSDIPTPTDFLPYIVTNAWLYQDLLLSYSYSGDHNSVLALFEMISPPVKTNVIEDTLALAYLEVAGESALRQAEKLRPGDLYVNFSLWRLAHGSGEDGQTDLYRQRLQRFPLSGVLPAHPGLMAYITDVIPELLTAGIWDKEQTANVVSLLIWQDAFNPEILRLTKRLSERFPSDQDWLFYQAEIYHRRGQFDQAERLYREVVKLDPAAALVYSRLGTIIQLQGNELGDASLRREALENYWQYYVNGGDDILAFKKINALCNQLFPDGQEDQICHDLKTVELTVTQLKSKHDENEEPVSIDLSSLEDRNLASIVAGLLGLGEKHLELGANLIMNGGFESWVNRGAPGMLGIRIRPEWWSWVDMSNHAPFNDGVFVGGPDELAPFEEEQVARIHGQWIAREATQQAARAGFWQMDEQTQGLRQIALQPNATYVLSFVYRTHNVPDGRTTVWVASADEPGSLWLESDPLLPSTGGAWYRFVGIARNDTQSVAVLRPLLRLYATGSVSFDGVVLHSVHFDNEELEVEEAKVYIMRSGKEANRE